MRSMGFRPPFVIPDFSRISGLLNLPAGYLPTQFNVTNALDYDSILSGGLSGYAAMSDFVSSGLLDSIRDGALSGLDNLSNLLDQLRDPGSTPSGVPIPQDSFDYLNAELAKYYGMDRNTAYQEALANTAYQRSVADMQRAGLNPAAIFGAGRGQGASGVAYVSSGGSSYSGSAKDAKLFSSEDFGLIASLAGLATAIVTKKPSNFWLGQQGAQAVMQVLNGLDRKFN